MKKRIISLILALALCVGMLPAPAWAEEPTDPTQAVEVVGAANPSEETDPTTEPTEAETAPTEAPTEAPAAEPTPAPTEVLAPETTVAPAPTEAPTEPAPTEDEAVAAVQAMIDALPDVEDMSESYLDALEAAYSAFDALSEAQQAQINGVEKLEALFNWVNSQVSTLATEETISDGVKWNNQTFTKPVKLTGDTTLTLTGTNRIECDQPLDLNGFDLTIQGTGTLELVGKGGSSFLVGATLCDSTWTGSSSSRGGALTLAGGTVKVRGSLQNAVCVYSLKLNGGNLEAHGGENAGIVCALLETTSGSLYATGDDYGISMYYPYFYGSDVNKLDILVSNKKDADIAEMESSDEKAIKNASRGKFGTVYIGEVSGPMLSVKAQKGYLYEGTADQTATFSYSAKNLDGCMFGVEWTGAHPGLTAEFSLSVDQTIIVTTKDTVKQGTYELKLIARDAENVNTLATKTFTVTVLGAPITVTTQPQDASARCKRGDLDAWQGDKEIRVTATLVAGLTGDIAYQWKLEDGTVLVGFNQPTLSLKNLYSGNQLPPVAGKPWLSSAKVYCTLTYGSHSVNTNAVTLTVNTCVHENAKPDGNCRQCGEPCSSEPLLVREDGAYYAVDTSGIGDAEVGGGILTSGGTFYLTKDVLSRDMNAGNYTAGSENVILDLQNHTLNRLKMGNFPYGSFTLKNGTLGVIQTVAGGKLILENIHYKDTLISAQFELTVQGENTRFEQPVAFHGTTHLRGGHFDGGLDFACVGRALELLEDGFAFYDSADKVVDATDSTKLVGKQIHVAAHTCHYSNGKCDCGRSCDHQGTVSDETGLCQKCGSQVYEANVTTADGTVTGYRTLEEALRSGADATVKLLADCVVKEREEAFCVEVPLTLDLNGKRMEGPSGLIVKKGPTTILDGSPAKTGTIAGTSNWEYSGMGLGVFNNANVTLTILGGRFEGNTDGLQLLGQNTLILKGGSFSSIRFKEGATATLRDSLAPGYAYYKDADNTLYDPGDDQEATVGLHVGAHPEHTPDSNGHCPCGYTVAATLDTEAGKQYFANFSVALEAAKAASGSTLTLFQDVALTGEKNLYIDSGTFTIDWNGHTLSGETSNALLCITDAAKVTLTDSVGTGGLRNTDGAAIGVYVRSQGSLTIQGGVYSPQLWKDRTAYGPIQISGGRFENPEDSGRNGALYCYSGALAELLAPGYTFAYEDDELFDVYSQRKSDSYKTVYAVAHTHDSFDEDGVCACGYTCPHEHWTDGMCDLCGKICPHEHYENGKCTVCGYACPHESVTENGGVYTCDICGLTMTVMVETADGNVSYTTDLAAALNNAEDGTTVKLLSDLVLTKSANIIGGNKTVTLDLNGHNITRATWQTIQVKGNTDDGTKAKLVITGSGEIRFNVKAIDGGQLDMSGWTGTVAWVDLENACDFVGPIGDGHLGELNISNWRSDNKGTILLQGGTIGKLWLNSYESFQMTLGSLLKSGYAAKSGSEYLPYDHAISQSDNTLNDLTIEPCPHTGLDSSGRCTYCGATDFVATVTKDGVTAGYTDFLSALDEICDGKRGTLKLLKDVSENGQYVYRISGTLDLNGKNLAGKLVCAQGSNLQIVNSGSDMSEMEKLEVWNGAKVTIADTAGSILFDMVTVESGSVADLLPEGGVYFRLDMRTWISAAEAATKQTLGSVVVREAPVQSVTLTANKTSVPYGESQTVTLTASATLSEGGTASYAWSEVKSDGTVQTFPEEVGTSFTLPADVNAGEYTYRVSVTVGDYTLSKDIQITVTKAKGKLVNKDYPTEFTYGQTVPTPKAENFTTNHPDGTFSYHWKTGNNPGLEPGANPVDAGTYILYATWTGGTNYTTASLSLAVTIQKAAQTANIAVVNETISGKGDSGVKLLPSADVYEIRMKGEATFEAISASQGETFHTLIPGVTYEIRLAETKNYLPSAIQEVTVQPGRKLKVTLPDKQEGYTLTANKTQLDWHENVELTFQLDSVGAYKAADFGIWAEAGSEKTKLTLGNDGAVKLTAPEKDITITVTGVKTDDVAPKVYIQGRWCKDSFDHVKWEGFQENPADDYVNGDFVISATDRGSNVASLWYCLSQTPLTRADMDTASWKQEGRVSITEDGVYYLYAKALDNANNAGYACTGKLVKESNPPTFSGVENGKTYYVSQMLKIHDDGMPDWYREQDAIAEVTNGGNKNPIEQRLDNYGRPYTITAGDRCGNEASITVYMKPLTDLTDRLYGILEDTIQKTDRATLDEVEATLKGLDVTYAFDSEKKEINDALAQIAELRQVLDQVAAVEAQIDALPDSVEPYQQTVEDTQIKPARDAYNSLTDHQKTLVDSTKLDKLVRLEAQLDAWTITEGDGQIWYKGSGKSLSFTVNGQKRKFDGIRQGNTYIGSGVSSLLTASGEMDEPFTLTLKPEFLQCQTPGEHSFTVVYYSGLYSSGYLSISVTYTVETPANYLDVTDREEFEGKTTVTVDGKEYPIEEMAGYLQRIPTQRYVNLPETGDLLTIYSFKDGTPAGSYTNYPTGMQVFRITRQEGGAKAEEITEFANLLNYAGCSIRLTGTKGIRMITGIGENARTALTGAQGLAGYTLEEYGTVVMRGVGTPTLENSNSHNFAYKKGKADPVFARVGGMIQYTNVLVGFGLEDCKDTLTLRPYIKLKDMTTGETVTLYGGCVSRSIGYIAKQNENTYQPGTAGYKYVHEIIDAVYGKTEQGGETK
uniref:hypothetical protein n=1 Tax=Faecousia sp. TaxID=2952921 RepID=UPI004025427B